MKQGVLPFQYQQENGSPGMTALSGLIIYLQVATRIRLEVIDRAHVGLREYGQGWTDSQIVNSLILLNLAGGESVVDLVSWRRTRGSAGWFARSRGETGSQRVDQGVGRAVACGASSESAVGVLRCSGMELFHDAGEEAGGITGAFIPSPHEALRADCIRSTPTCGLRAEPFASAGWHHAGHDASFGDRT